MARRLQRLLTAEVNPELRTVAALDAEARIVPRPRKGARARQAAHAGT
jgi:hypothetical protein